jgi:hypothetical protein
MTVGTDNLVSYSLTKDFPKTKNVFTNTALTQLKSEALNVNSGVRVINDSGSGATFLDLLQDSSQVYLTITEAGEYVFDLTINGVVEKVTLVAEAYPTIKLTSVSAGGVKLNEVAATPKAYLVPDGVKVVNVLGTAVTLPAGVYYKLSVHGTDVAGNTVDSTVDIENILAANIAGQGLKLLNLTSGVDLQFVTDGDATTILGANWAAAETAYISITLYTRSLDATSTVAVPVYDFTAIGHLALLFWWKATVPGTTGQSA